jgi:hypothetical protein
MGLSCLISDGTDTDPDRSPGAQAELMKKFVLLVVLATVAAGTFAAVFSLHLSPTAASKGDRSAVRQWPLVSADAPARPTKP